MLLKANKVKVVNKPLYYYRIGGLTSKYMPYFFDDIVSGYKIQKKVIEEYYQGSGYNGISIMLLNTLKTCITNLFYSTLDKSEIKNRINQFLLNESIKETLNNEGCLKYFDKDYLDAIANQNTEFLFLLGEIAYKKSKPKRLILNMLSKIY